MIVIACIDNNYGMMFNNRRQSQDKVVTQKIMDITKGKFWVNAYSYPLFSNSNNTQINVDNSFLNEAANNDYCFVENCSLALYEKYIEKIILFKWNRIYPADQYFDINLTSWILSQTNDFMGNSHELITMEVYEK